MAVYKWIHIIAILAINLISTPTYITAQTISKLDTIIDTKAPPFNCICYQEIERKKFLSRATFKSTGFLIRRNVILTAAHNVYSNGISNVTKIKIYPGRYKGTYAHTPVEIHTKEVCHKAIKVHSSYRFTSRNRINYDFAVIIIPQTIIDATPGWVSNTCFDLDKNYTLKNNDTINVAGFPADNGYDGSLMTYQNQNCGTVYDMHFSHDFDTQKGNSGSPIWINVKGKRIAVGIHTFGEAGTKLTKEDIDIIVKWISLNQD